MPSLRRFAPVLAASVLLSMVGGGCFWPGNNPGGQGASRDQYTYVSTPDAPQNVTVIDWTTKETLLTVEIPVGQQLVMRFFPEHDNKNATRPDLLRWKLMKAGTQFGELTNSLPVPDYTHRRVDATLRTTREAVPKPNPTDLPPPEPVAKPPATPAPK